MICALVYAKRERTYQIDTASLMLATEHWIPIEGMQEVGLLEALTGQKRRFLKPLRYDARSAAPFPNALLLDTGDTPTPPAACCQQLHGSQGASGEGNGG